MQELSVDVRKQKLAQCQNDQKLTEEQLELTDNRLKGKKGCCQFCLRVVAHFEEYAQLNL